MQYMGGKSRIARSIAEIINEIPRRKIKNCQTHCSDNHAGCGGDCFVSLFCGSCAVESKVQGFSRKLLNDRHEYLIAMLQGVQQGYNLPEHITLEQYRYIRENKDADPAKNQGGIAIVQLAVENHPQDSRVKINEDGVVQTLSGQMGTGGGGNVPLILENK